MNADEQYVRERWDDSFERLFEDHRTSLCCGYPDCDGDLPGEPHESCCPGHIADGSYWSAAAAFTREREEQIRQVKEEIKLLDEISEGLMCDSSARPLILHRIKISREAALAELQKGLRNG